MNDRSPINGSDPTRLDVTKHALDTMTDAKRRAADSLRAVEDLNRRMMDVVLGYSVQLQGIERDVGAVRQMGLEVREKGRESDAPEDALKAYESRVKGIAAAAADLRARLEMSQRDLNEEARLRGVVASRLDSVTAAFQMLRITVGKLQEELVAAHQQIEELTEKNEELAEKLEHAETELDERNRVYVRVGSEGELLVDGLVRKTGGAKIFGIGPKVGQTLDLVPHGNPAFFTALDARNDTVLNLGRYGRYKVLSDHSLMHTQLRTGSRTFEESVLRIRDPEFWYRGGSFLVIQRLSHRSPTHPDSND